MEFMKAKDTMNDRRKEDKIRNMLHSMHTKGIIVRDGPSLSSTNFIQIILYDKLFTIFSVVICTVCICFYYRFCVPGY